ncbi:sigma-54 interaction domain-containing protein [Calditrichota bacterium]
MTEIKTSQESINLLRSQVEDFQRLFQILKSVSSSLEIEKILELIISEAISICHADHGSIILFDPEKNKIAKTLIRSEESKELIIDKYLNNLLAGWVSENVNILITNDLSDTFGKNLIKEKYQNITSALSVPIKKNLEILGVINLVSLNNDYQFGDREKQLMEILATQCEQIISNAKLHESLFFEANRLRKELDEKFAFREVIGNSPKLKEVFSLLKRIIPTDARVMIEGKSGTGKELIARILHYNGPNKNGPFVAVDCGAFPEKLLESELFGYVKGAFTGALKDKSGLFEEAHNGTLFLDEITNMPESIQSKLLRVLQESEIRPVGSTKTRKVQVRVIAAASDSIKEKLNKGDFREDLYYRLNVMNLNLPSLRERQEDIILLAHHFIKKYASKYKKNISGLKAETLDFMQHYSWPGNIRELENVIERMVILSEPDEQIIPPDLLSAEIRSNSVIFPANQELKIKFNKNSIHVRKSNYEKEILISTLEKNNWNQSTAAQELNIHESTIRYKMKRYGIKKPKN